MKRIFLIRHGESISNITPGLNNDHYVGLTSKGIKQSKATGRLLSNFLSNQSLDIWHSPFKRVRQTVDGMKKHLNHQIDFITEEPFLSEMDFGYFDALSKDEIKQKYPDEYAQFIRVKKHKGKYWAKRPHGESPRDVDIRLIPVRQSIDEALHNSDSKNIAIVAHGIVLNVLLMRYLKLSPEVYNDMNYADNATIQILEFENKQWKHKGFLS